MSAGDRMSDDARHAVVEAQTLAFNDQSDAIDTEHLRVACANLAEGRRTVPADWPRRGHIPFTVGTKQVLEAAIRLAEADPDAEQIELKHLAEAVAS